MRAPSPRAAGLLVAATAVALLPLARTWGLQWGASEDELDARLAGDDIITVPGLVATRGITIRASAEQVWPWLVQLGQDRGGFYSYDWLENLVGLHIHSASRIEDRWQGLAEGDEIHLAPSAALAVTIVDPPRALVLTAPDASFSWAFTLHPGRDRTTRLVVRERYARPRGWAVPINEIVGSVSTVMSRRMLIGIRDRVEGTVR